MNSGNNNNNKAKGRPKKEATSSAAAAATVKSLAMQFLAGKIGTTRKTGREGEGEKPVPNVISSDWD